MHKNKTTMANGFPQDLPDMPSKVFFTRYGHVRRIVDRHLSNPHFLEEAFLSPPSLFFLFKPKAAA